MWIALMTGSYENMSRKILASLYANQGKSEALKRRLKEYKLAETRCLTFFLVKENELI